MRHASSSLTDLLHPVRDKPLQNISRHHQINGPIGWPVTLSFVAFWEQNQLLKLSGRGKTLSKSYVLYVTILPSNSGQDEGTDIRHLNLITVWNGQLHRSSLTMFRSLVHVPRLLLLMALFRARVFHVALVSWLPNFRSPVIPSSWLRRRCYPLATSAATKCA